jgi:hypothetical protein
MAKAVNGSIIFQPAVRLLWQRPRLHGLQANMAPRPNGKPAHFPGIRLCHRFFYLHHTLCLGVASDDNFEAAAHTDQRMLVVLLLE